MASIEQRLRELSEQHARELDAAMDAANDAATRAYEDAAKADGPGRYLTLRSDLEDIVHRVRSFMNDLAAAHMLEEVGVAVERSGMMSLPLAGRVRDADVSEYIDGAIDLARQHEDSVAETAYRAHTIIESEASAQYDQARHTIEQALARLTDEQAAEFGFQVARSERQLHGLSERESQGLIPVLGKRWSAYNDRRTCEICRSADDSIAILALSFSTPGPPAHARCRCISHLWAVGYVKRAVKGSEPRRKRRAMQDTDRREVPAVARTFSLVEIDEREIDEAARTIRNVVASDESLDSHDSIIKAKGWDLGRYQKNPVLDWGHVATHGFAEPADILGTADIRLEGKRLIADLRFDTDPKSEEVYGKMKRRVIRAVSVAFKPKKYHFEKSEGGEVLVIDEQELVSLSVVPIPSNPNTLMNSYTEMRAICEKHAVLSDDEPVESNAAAQPHQPEESDMTDQKTQGAAPVTLPPELARILGVDDIGAAVGAIAERDLEAKNLKAQIEDAKAATEAAKAEVTEANERADKAEKLMHDYIEADVDALIKSGREPEEKRAALLDIARLAPSQFRKLYPVGERAPEAPMAKLLSPEPVVKPQQPAKAKESRKIDVQSVIADVRREMPNLPYDEACARAYERIQNELSA